VELDPSCRDSLAAFAERVIIADLNKDDFFAELRGKMFDVIIVADVLEHLYDPWSLLPKIAALLRPTGSIVCSLPNASHAAILGCLASNDFDYRDWGLLDRTHIRFFGIRNIQAMFEEAGFYVHAAAFVTFAPEQTEFAEIWKRLSEEERACFQLGEFSHVYQTVVDARLAPSSPPAHALKLKDMAPPKKILPLMYRLGGTTNRHTNFVIQTARRWLPMRVKSVLKRLSGW
jgi:SAM-dependent methyltransferase